jgi:hypothetical protein
MRPLFQLLYRILFFKFTREDILQFGWQHFFMGLCGTWLAGMGRYWDDEGAGWAQKAGLGSVIYVFLLAGFIWLIVLPFRRPGWSYFRVLCFVSLTSFPALLYAVPAERFMSISEANALNAFFLAIVATWRLCLYYRFLKRYSDYYPDAALRYHQHAYVFKPAPGGF